MLIINVLTYFLVFLLLWLPGLFVSFIIVDVVLVGCQVAAQTKHDVTLVDISEDLLKKSRKNVETSLARVAKKRFADNTTVGWKY